MRPCKIMLIMLTVLAAALLGCQPKAPADLTETDREAIREVTAGALRIVRESDDWTVYTNHYYTPDAIVFPPNAEAVTGRENIVSFFESFPTITEMQFNMVEIGGAGDMAYVYGRYSLTMDTGGEKPVQDVGKYIEIWKRQPDGAWKVSRDIFNSDLPLAGAE